MMMEALKIALMLLACAACSPTVSAPPKVVQAVTVPPPAGVWSCPAWPQEDELSLPTTAEEVIQWHRVQRARDQLAFEACKTDLVRLRDWAKSLGLGRGR